MRSARLSARRSARAPHGQDVVERRDAAFRRANGDAPSGLDLEPGPWLHEEVRRLPEKYRTLVLLCYFEGLTHEQTAARIGCPIGTVKGRLARARDLLRRRLVRRGITLSAASLSGHLAGAGVRAAVPESLRYATCEAARAIAGTAGASLVVAPSVVLPVASLTDGVLRAMIITQAKVIAIPLLIAGIVTTGAVIGTAQQPATPKPSVSVTRTTQRTEYADRKVVGEGVSKTVGAAAPDPQNAETRPAMQLLAEEGRADQEMFDFFSADNRDVRRDDAQMLKRLSLRMLAVARELGADTPRARRPNAAHRDRMKNSSIGRSPPTGMIAVSSARMQIRRWRLTSRKPRRCLNVRRRTKRPPHPGRPGRKPHSRKVPPQKRPGPEGGVSEGAGA